MVDGTPLYVFFSKFCLTFSCLFCYDYEQISLTFSKVHVHYSIFPLAKPSQTERHRRAWRRWRSVCDVFARRTPDCSLCTRVHTYPWCPARSLCHPDPGTSFWRTSWAWHCAALSRPWPWKTRPERPGREARRLHLRLLPGTAQWTDLWGSSPVAVCPPHCPPQDSTTCTL